MGEVHTIRPMHHKSADWSERGPTLNSWVQGLPTWFLKALWDMRGIEDADPGCFLVQAVQEEMQYRGQGDYVAI